MSSFFIIDFLLLLVINLMALILQETIAHVNRKLQEKRRFLAFLLPICFDPDEESTRRR
jgi:hypothetical protein